MIIIGIIGASSQISRDIIQDLENEFWFTPLSLKDDDIDIVESVIQESRNMNYSGRYVIDHITSSEEFEKLKEHDDVLFFYVGKSNGCPFESDSHEIHQIKTYDPQMIINIMGRKFWFELALNPPT